jgi:class 3 adenylate cyclase
MTDDLKTELRAILFLDVTGWSKLSAAEIRSYVTGGIPKLLEQLSTATFKNTWGDSIVATFHSAREAAECALDIRDFFRRTPESEGVPVGLVPRIALHVGEVFTAYNPLIEREDVFGDSLSNGSFFRANPVFRLPMLLAIIGSFVDKEIFGAATHAGLRASFLA